MNHLKKRKDPKFQALLTLLVEHGIGADELDCAKYNVQATQPGSPRLKRSHWGIVLQAEHDAVNGRREGGGSMLASSRYTMIERLIQNCCEDHDRIAIMKFHYHRSGRGVHTHRVRTYAHLGTFCVNCEKLAQTDQGRELLGANFAFANTIREFLLLGGPCLQEERRSADAGSSANA